MIIIVDEREAVLNGYSACFDREGIPVTGLLPADFGAWVGDAAAEDMSCVEAFLLGDFGARRDLPGKIKARSAAPVIALSDARSLDETLNLFASGVDDVLRKPVHVREILARINAITRRTAGEDADKGNAPLRCYFDGRDPEVAGAPMPLPRRERRILEYLVQNRGRRVTKAQIFNHVYGLLDDGIDENVIESHTSKLRKKLRHRLGYDPIDSQRYLGYRLLVA
ncbi:MAG: response regulator transcription factor [Hyphomicrobiales bacterium]|nr:response regulator transcription factor [Hyphomicrobiales bacterium]